MFKKLAYSTIVALFIFISFATFASARTNVDYWYIKDFKTNFTILDNGNLRVVENITADCGNMPEAHGIFRVLPEVAKTENGTIKNPITLESVVDFDGNSIKYTTSRDPFKHTLTIKIGDANKTVHGENYYQITYLVKNAIRFQDGFDEFYWNLSGNFWTLEIDNFSAKIFFPQGINKTNTTIDYYTGELGSKAKNLAAYQWETANTLVFKSTQSMYLGEGITVSASLPKGFIIQSASEKFWIMWGGYFYLIIPILVFIFCCSLWKKYGKDARVDKAIVPEYDAPDNLSPIIIGAMNKNCKFTKNSMAAGIVNMATKGFLTIEKIEKTGIFGKDDFKLTKTNKPLDESLCLTEKTIFEKLFEGRDTIILANLKRKFISQLQAILLVFQQEILNLGFVTKQGNNYSAGFIIFGVIVGIAGMYLVRVSPFLCVAMVLSSIFLIAFGAVMPKVTEKGAELKWKIKGFKLFMETAEKYRQQFNEKENIFEKLLPYAIALDITKLWIQKTEQLYGAEYLRNYHPVWLAGGMATFNAENFSSAMAGVASAVASSVGTSSGAGGSGHSGGGGGGGGGGGW